MYQSLVRLKWCQPVSCCFSISQNICTLCVWTCPAMREQHAPTPRITPSRGRSGGSTRYTEQRTMKRVHQVLQSLPWSSVLVRHSAQFAEAVRLNRKPFHVVGTSMGGQVAGVYAACYPSQICSITLICPDGQWICVRLTTAALCRNTSETQKMCKSRLKSFS